MKKTLILSQSQNRTSQFPSYVFQLLRDDDEWLLHGAQSPFHGAPLVPPDVSSLPSVFLVPLNKTGTIFQLRLLTLIFILLLLRRVKWHDWVKSSSLQSLKLCNAIYYTQPQVPEARSSMSEGTIPKCRAVDPLNKQKRLCRQKKSIVRGGLRLFDDLKTKRSNLNWILNDTGNQCRSIRESVKDIFVNTLDGKKRKEQGFAVEILLITLLSNLYKCPFL